MGMLRRLSGWNAWGMEDKLATIESEREVSALLSQRRLPRTYHWLYKRSDDYVRAHLPSVLDKLCDDGVISAEHSLPTVMRRRTKFVGQVAEGDREATRKRPRVEFPA